LFVIQFRSHLTFQGAKVCDATFCPQKKLGGADLSEGTHPIPPYNWTHFLSSALQQTLLQFYCKKQKYSSDLLKLIRDAGSQWRIADAQRRCGRRQWHSPAFNIIAHEGHGPDRVQRQPNSTIRKRGGRLIICPGGISPSRWLP
jgi:hypothetical protein